MDTDERVNFGAADNDDPIGECDCCGRVAELSRVWYGGVLETWCCQQCRSATP